jgi:hypothetical protein
VDFYGLGYGTVAGSLEHDNEPFELHNMLSGSWLREEVFASEEGLYSS